MIASPTETVLQNLRDNWPDALTARDRSVLLIQRIARLARDNASRALGPFGLSFTEFEVLCALRAGPPPHTLLPSALYEAVLISSGGLTKVLKSLEEAGLIERLPHGEDGRTRPAALTRRGVTLVESAIAAVRDADAAMLDGALSGAGEYDRLEGDLRALTAALECRGGA